MSVYFKGLHCVYCVFIVSIALMLHFVGLRFIFIYTDTKFINVIKGSNRQSIILFTLTGLHQNLFDYDIFYKFESFKKVATKYK